jgi:hypothetical protein
MKCIQPQLSGSIALWRRYIDIAINILDITHHLVFFLKHSLTETGFYLRLHVVSVECAQLSPEDKNAI